MRTKGIFKFAFRSLKSNKMYFTLTSILLIFCFVLFGICEFLYVRVEYNRYVANRLLSQGTDNTGILRMDDGFHSEEAVNFRLEAFNDGIVDSIGGSSVSSISWSCLNELIKIQAGSSKLNPEYYNNNSLGYLCVDATLMTVCDLKLQTGSMINKENFDYKNRDLVAVYLGDLFSDIPIGTEYEHIIKSKNGDDRVITIRVMGIIAEGEEWVDESIGDYQGDIAKSNYNLDNEVIMAFNDTSITGIWFYSLKDGCNMEETQKSLYNLADKHNLKIILGSVSGRFDVVEAKYTNLREILFTLLIFVTVISTMIIICFNAVSILSRKKQYGILLASGVSTMGLFVSLFVEQIIKAFTGLLLSVLVIYLGAPLFFEAKEITTVYDIFLNFVLWKTAVFCVLECAVVSAVSILILGHHKPVQLIKHRC